MKKRILSIFLTLALLLTLLPTAAFAAGNTICTDMIYKGTKTSSFAQPYAAIAELNANADTARSGATLDFSASNAMTSAVPEVPAFVKSFQITERSKTLTTTDISWENSYIPVTWESPSDSDQATLTNIPFRYEVTCGGRTYSETANKENSFEPSITLESGDFIYFSASDGDLGNNMPERILIFGTLSYGVYQISVFAPDANGGEIQQDFILIVNSASNPTKEVKIQVAVDSPTRFGATDLNAFTIVSVDGQRRDDLKSQIEYYINGKKLADSTYDVMPNLFHLGDNELRAIYPGDETYSPSITTVTITVEKANNAEITGFTTPSGGAFNGTAYTGSLTNPTIKKYGVTLDNNPAVTVEYTLDGQAVSAPVFPGSYSVTLSAPEGETYTAIRQDAGEFTISKATPTVTVAAAETGSGTVELTATVSGVGAYYPAGNVTFQLGEWEGVADLNNGTASKTIDNLTAGTYSYSASYAPADSDTLYESANSDAQSITVGGSTPVTPTLKSIAITTPSTKTEYTVGDTFDPTGMVVTATYNDSSTEIVTSDKYTISPTGALNRDSKIITVSYTEGGVTQTATQDITVKGKTATADMLTLTDPGLTYNGNDQIDAIKNSVALRTNYTDKVGVPTVTVGQNGNDVTSAVNADEYEVYVSCDEGTEYDALAKTLLGTVAIGKAGPNVGTVTVKTEKIFVSTELSQIILEKSGSTGGTLTLDVGQILMVGTNAYNWTFTPDDQTNYTTATGKVSLTVQNDALASISYTGTPNKTSYKYGEVFDPTGITVIAQYDSGAEIELSRNEYTFDGKLAVGQAAVTLTYQGKTCEVTGITVGKAMWTGGISDQQITHKYDLTGTQTANFPTALLPADMGSIRYELRPYTDRKGILSSNSVSVNADTGALSYTLAGKASDSAGDSATIPVAIEMGNYESVTVNFVITLTDRGDAKVTLTGAPASVVYGDSFTLTAAAGNAGTNGTWIWTSSDPAVLEITGDGSSATVNALKASTAPVTITVSYSSESTEDSASASATITVNRRVISVKADSKSMVVGGTFPALTVSYGNFASGDSADTVFATQAAASTTADGKTAGSFFITVTAPALKDDWADKYEIGTPANGTLTVRFQSSGGGSSSGNSGTKTETTTNQDGSTTKTETKADGTVTTTTTNKDGSTIKTETKKDGSSVTERRDASGSTGTVKTDANGRTESSAKISDKALSDAKSSGNAVTVPVEVDAGRNSNSAPTVSVDLPRNSGETKIEIPVSNANSGTVAVIVHPDGTEEIARTSTTTENGVQLTVNGSTTIKIIDNSKDFIDTRNHWSRDQVNFVAARELFQGVGNNQFGVGQPMTRGMVNTVLARLAGIDTTPAVGQKWYDKGIAWAQQNGISDGTNPNGNVTREQLSAMLYRYAGSPAVSGTLPFTDAHEANLYAQDALLWAVQNGIISGYGDGRVGPKANAERAQVAAMMARFIQNTH